MYGADLDKDNILCMGGAHACRLVMWGTCSAHGARKTPFITCKVHEQARVIEEQDQGVERRRGAVLGDDGDDGERREDVRVVQQHEGCIACADARVDWVELDGCGLAA